MRTESAYIFECEACNAHIESHAPEGQCAACGALWEIRGWGVTADDRK
jgi:rRNA maturation endonuclease Nob1